MIGILSQDFENFVIFGLKISGFSIPKTFDFRFSQFQNFGFRIFEFKTSEFDIRNSRFLNFSKISAVHQFIYI